MSRPSTHRRAWLVGLGAVAAGTGLVLGVATLPAAFASQDRKPQEPPKSATPALRPDQSQPAQSPAAAVQDESLPSAKEVLAKYVEATGGAEAYKALKSQHATGTFAVPSMGLEGKMELFQQQPDKLLMVIDVPGMGQIQQGLNGQTGWASDPMQGTRLLEGKELADFQRAGDMQAVLTPEKYYESMVVTAVEDVNGEQAYRVSSTPKSGGEPRIEFYSVESGLLLKAINTEESPMGKVEMETLMQEYGPIGADGKLTQPHKMTITAMGADRIVTFEKIETNVEVDAGRFEVPADVKALVEKQASEKQEAQQTE